MKVLPAIAPADLLDELAPVVAAGLDRHLATTAEWFPHEYVPYEQGRNYLTDPWSPADSRLPDVAGIALEVNLLTEDNLPYYHLNLWDAFGRHDGWAEWLRRWTAEEGRHSIVLRDYLTVTRGVDPVPLERGRMEMVQIGYYPSWPELGPLDTVVFTTLQELATRVSHRNTGLITDDETAQRLTARIATDENLHYVFYRDLVAATLDLDPSSAVLAMHRQVLGFEMPGIGMPDFAEKAKRMATAGIYNFRIHLEHILTPVLLTHWRLTELEGLSDDAELARDEIVAYMERLERVGARLDLPTGPVDQVDHLDPRT
ncbi:MAG: acyl-ACP desaturase [Actinomycetota bacterium]